MQIQSLRERIQLRGTWYGFSMLTFYVLVCAIALPFGILLMIAETALGWAVILTKEVEWAFDRRRAAYVRSSPKEET